MNFSPNNLHLNFKNELLTLILKGNQLTFIKIYYLPNTNPQTNLLIVGKPTRL